MAEVRLHFNHRLYVDILVQGFHSDAMVLGVILILSLSVISRLQQSIWIYGCLQAPPDAFSVSEGNLPICSIKRLRYRRVASSTAFFGSVRSRCS